MPFQQGNQINTGRKFSDEHKRNMSLAKSGNKNPMFGNRYSEEEKRAIGIRSKNIPRTEEWKRKIGDTLRGKEFTEIRKRNISNAKKGKKRLPLTEITKKKMSLSRMGIQFSEKTRQKMSEARIGKYSKENHPNWQGGKSFEFYPQDWTDDLKESIRKRDNYTCQECGIHQDELNRKLHVHHIDYDKKNCNPTNFVTLCPSCHMKTNFNKEYWIKYFNDGMPKWNL